MSNKRNILLSVRLSDIEKSNLDALVLKYGCGASDLFRRLLTEKYLKIFPAYIQEKKGKSKKEQYFESLKVRTSENLCEVWKGVLEKDQGVLKCMKKYGKSRTSWKPLDRGILIRAIREDIESGLLEMPEN
mgnify:CR=1 FL=1